MTRFDTVLLDVDGTLVDSTYVHVVAWSRAFRRHGYDVPGARIQRAIGLGGDRLVGYVAGDEAEERHGDAIREVWKAEADAMLDDVGPLPGAGDLLDALRERGLRVVLATSGKPNHTEHAVKVLEAADRVDHVTTSDDADESKPAPDILRVGLEAVGGTTPLVVGDAVWDVEAASRIGALCVGVLTGGLAREELESAGAVAVYDDLPALIADLDSLLAHPR